MKEPKETKGSPTDSECSLEGRLRFGRKQNYVFGHQRRFRNTALCAKGHPRNSLLTSTAPSDGREKATQCHRTSRKLRKLRNVDKGALSKLGRDVPLSLRDLWGELSSALIDGRG